MAVVVEIGVVVALTDICLAVLIMVACLYLAIADICYAVASEQ